MTHLLITKCGCKETQLPTPENHRHTTTQPITNLPKFKFHSHTELQERLWSVVFTWKIMSAKNTVPVFMKKKERITFENKLEILDTHKSVLYQKWLLFKEFFYIKEKKIWKIHFLSRIQTQRSFSYFMYVYILNY